MRDRRHGRFPVRPRFRVGNARPESYTTDKGRNAEALSLPVIFLSFKDTTDSLV